MTDQLKLHHICIRVSNLKQSEVFYSGFLGLEKLWKFTMPVQEAQALFGLEHECRFVTLATGNGNLELVSAPGKLLPVPEGMHFCLAVANREKILARLEGAHVAAREIVREGKRIIFVEDPDGYWVELKELEDTNAF